MYYSLRSLILLNHLHHRKFDYCLISSYFCIYQLFFLSVICWQTAKGLINTLMIKSPLIPPDWLRFQEKHSLRGIYNINQRATDAEKQDFQRQTYIFCCPYKYFQHNADSYVSRAKHAAKKSSKGNNSVTFRCKAEFNGFFLMGVLFYSGINR